MIHHSEYVISAVPMDYPYREVTGEEAKHYLDSLGYSFIHQDEECGTFQALDDQRRPVRNYRVYKRQRAAMM